MTPSEATGRIREAIEAARAAEDVPERESHVRAAVGEAVALRVQTDLRAADLEEQLTNVLVAPDEEAPYFLNQAEQLLGFLEDDLPAAVATDGGTTPTPEDGVVDGQARLGCGRRPRGDNDE